MVTVHDVAALSGVSIATVSRTLREPHRVTGETRERVQAAIDELGYRPNRAASGLRRGRTGVIALVVPDIENPYFSAMTRGAQASARSRGYGLVVVDTTEDAEIEADEIRALRSQIDGIILASSRLDEGELAAIATASVSVLVHRDLSELGIAAPSVTIDEDAAARAAVSHLTGLGHRRIAYVGGPPRAWSESRRAAAMRAAAEGVAEIVALEGTTADAPGGRAAASAVLECGATATIAYNDLVALGLLARWTELGVRVPDDMSLVGVDNTFVTELTTPHLTSVGADLRELGDAAVGMLVDRIDGGDGALRRLLTAMLVVRDSTAAPGRA